MKIFFLTGLQRDMWLYKLKIWISVKYYRNIAI